MDTDDAVTPPATVPRSVDFSNPSSLFSSYSTSAAATTMSSNNNNISGTNTTTTSTIIEDDQQEDNSSRFMNEVMNHFKQYQLQKEHADLTKKFEELTFQNHMAGLFAKYHKK